MPKLPEECGCVLATEAEVIDIAWAFGYNLLLVPLAAGLALPAFGIGLDPALAAAAMGLSSVSVVANSLRLRRLKLTS